MKKIAAILAALAVGACMQAGSAFANPSCVLLKFTDDTRFDRVESTGTLSDLVMEKLLSSGKFNFKETKVIPENLEKRLYDERAEELNNAYWAMQYGNYSRLFEGPGFNESKAQSIASASLGQFVSPEITSYIGQQHNADYIIQGTIINLGTGDWMDEKISNIAQYANAAISMTGSMAAANLLGPVGMLASSVKVKKTGIGVQADLRLIQASTGKVVWYKRVTGLNIQKQINVMGAKIGSDKLSGDMYYKAMEDGAQKICDAIVADYEAGLMFK